VNIFMGILKFFLLLFKRLEVVLMLLFSHRPLLFSEASITTSSEEGIIMVINTPAILLAA